MDYDARASELREMVRNQYPELEVGTVDEATAREIERKAVLGAIERYGADLSSRLKNLVSCLDGSDAERTWEREVAGARSTMHATFADSLRDVKVPTLLGLKIVVGGTDEESKVFDALANAKSVGAAMEALVRYRNELEQKTDALERKWNESSRIAETIMREEEEVLKEIKDLMAEAVANVAEKNKNRRELARALIKDAADAVKVIGAVLPLPPYFKEILESTRAGTEIWEEMAGDVNARKARYEGYFSQDHTSLLVTFKGARDDARDFLDKHDYTRLVLDWTSKARQSLADLRSAAKTAGQKADIDAFASAVMKKLDDAEKTAKEQWDSFVTVNSPKFFGSFTPELDRVLVGSERWNEKYKAIAAIDLQGTLSKWIEDDRRDWREIDAQVMPEAWHDELCEAFKESLENLAKTEEEILRNNGTDTLQTWVLGKSAELANRLR